MLANLRQNSSTQSTVLQTVQTVFCLQRSSAEAKSKQLLRHQLNRTRNCT